MTPHDDYRPRYIVQHDAPRDERQDDQGVRDVADVNGGYVQQCCVIHIGGIDSASSKISASQEIHDTSLEIGECEVRFLLEGRREVGHGQVL